MTSRAACVFAAAIALLLSPRAFAQDDDDLLAPLVPGKSKPRPAKRKPKVAPKPGAKPEVDEDLLAPLAVGRGQLVVKLLGGVRGAKLLVGDREQGTLPLPPVELPPGEHAVVVRRAGFADFARTVSVKEGLPTELTVTLEPVGGALSVTASVPGAVVFVDGRTVGQVPLVDAPLTLGAHDVLVQKDGFAEFRAHLQVKAGKDYAMHAEVMPLLATDRPALEGALTPSASASEASESPLAVEAQVSAPSPWYRRWYVWAGVGAVVVAASAATIVGVRNAGAGVNDPRAVCSLGGAPRDCSGTIGLP